MTIAVREILSKSALYYKENDYDTKWDLNIYRGCEHGCIYCYAGYTHKYLNNGDFSHDIYVKTNIAKLLDKEFSRKSWKHEAVSISKISDCYQPIERKYELMPKVLNVFLKHENPVVLITKSNLILRDIKLIKKLAKVTELNVSVTITSLDEATTKKIEPNASTVRERVEILEKLKDTGCKVTLLIMPIIPFITDDNNNLEDIFRLAKFYGVDAIEAWLMHLRDYNKNRFLSFAQKKYPTKYNDLNQLYKSRRIPKHYRQACYSYIEELRNRFDITNRYYVPSYKGPSQLDFLSFMKQSKTSK